MKYFLICVGIILGWNVYQSNILSQQYNDIHTYISVLDKELMDQEIDFTIKLINQEVNLHTTNAKIEILDKSIDSDKKRKIQINTVLAAIKEKLPKGGNPLPNCSKTPSSGELLKLASAIVDMSNRYAVSLSLILAVIRQESAFCNEAISPAGARGYMQLMPETATQVAIDIGTGAVLWNTRDNIQLGTAYLSHLFSIFHGNPALAVRAYNAGPIHVKRVIAKEINNFHEETENYYQKVMIYKEQFESLGIP